MRANKGDWVTIEKIALPQEERTGNLPEDTKKLPLLMWSKGFILNDQANIGDLVEIESYIGRRIQGKLIEINPSYDHSFGKAIPELLYIGRQARQKLEDGGLGE